MVLAGIVFEFDSILFVWTNINFGAAPGRWSLYSRMLAVRVENDIDAVIV